MPRQQGCRRDDYRDLFQDFPAEFLRPCCQTATLVVRESHPWVPHLFSKDAIFLGEIFNDMLLVLVHPASDGNDQKREWIQTGVHFRSLARSMWKLFERIDPSESSFWISRDLLSDPRTAPSGIPLFDLDDRCNDFLPGLLWARLLP